MALLPGGKCSIPPLVLLNLNWIGTVFFPLSVSRAIPPRHLITRVIDFHIPCIFPPDLDSVPIRDFTFLPYSTISTSATCLYRPSSALVSVLFLVIRQPCRFQHVLRRPLRLRPAHQLVSDSYWNTKHTQISLKADASSLRPPRCQSPQ